MYIFGSLYMYETTLTNNYLSLLFLKNKYAEVSSSFKKMLKHIIPQILKIFFI